MAASNIELSSLDALTTIAPDNKDKAVFACFAGAALPKASYC